MAQHFTIADLTTEGEIREFLQSLTKPQIKEFLKTQCLIHITNFDRTTKPKLIEQIIKSWDTVLKGMTKKDI